MGTGSAIAHRAVDGMMGPRTMQVEHVGAPAPEAAAPMAPAMAAQAPAQGPCGDQAKAFAECMSRANGDFNACTYYFEVGGGGAPRRQRLPACSLAWSLRPALARRQQAAQPSRAAAERPPPTTPTTPTHPPTHPPTAGHAVLQGVLRLGGGSGSSSSSSGGGHWCRLPGRGRARLRGTALPLTVRGGRLGCSSGGWRCGSPEEPRGPARPSPHGGGSGGRRGVLGRARLADNTQLAAWAPIHGCCSGGRARRARPVRPVV
jgi:hypothetical protein